MAELAPSPTLPEPLWSPSSHLSIRQWDWPALPNSRAFPFVLKLPLSSSLPQGFYAFGTQILTVNTKR
jgi:hypothetical protein